MANKPEFNPEALMHKDISELTLSEKLRVRAFIRRNDTSRKSVKEGRPDRAADLMEEAADALEELQPQHHAELRNAVWSKTYAGSLEGECWNDTKRRFSDGKWIYTSTIVEFIGPNLVRTRNTIYKVTMKADDNGQA